MDIGFSAIIQKVVKEQRQMIDISQEELASRANLDRTYISGFERGVRNITLQSLEKIIKGLGISYKTFFSICLREFEGEKLDN